MGLQVGIVGLPNVGKSTLFNALTSAKAEAANYPFCTIDPNVGVVTVPDARLDELAKIIGSKEKIPTVIEFVDIAGLVEGASKGEGLGNQFLSHIRQTDAIAHVVRCFEDPNVIHVAGSVDPLRDMAIIETELMLADLDSIEKKLAKMRNLAKGGLKPDQKAELEVVEAIAKALEAGKAARTVTISDDKVHLLKDLHLLTLKPVLYVCNVSEEDIAKNGNAFVDKVRIKAAEEKNKVIVVCSKLEEEIAQLELSERAEFIEAAGLKEPGLNLLIVEAYKLLNLVTYFTVGPKEARAWTIKQGTLAPQAAGVIHTDFERGFIRAETYHCSDLFEFKTEAAIKEKGKFRSEGKDYLVKDGDVMLFRFNV
jgi:GTP-binding protein YchF